MELAESSREGNNEDSLNPGGEILGTPHDDGAIRLSNPVAAKDSGYLPTEDEVLRIYSKDISLIQYKQVTAYTMVRFNKSKTSSNPQMSKWKERKPEPTN